MGINDSTELNLVDLAVQGGLNYFGTAKAAESGDLRTCWGKEGRLYQDYRVAGFGLGILAYMAGDGMIERAGFDLAAGTGHSVLATETIRSQAIKRAQARDGGGQGGGQAQRQIPENRPAFNSPIDDREREMANGAPVYGLPGMFR